MKAISLVLFYLFVTNLGAQEIWTLGSCVDYANKNNLGLQQSKISVEEANLSLLESRQKQLPDLNGAIGGGLSFGRNVDPTSNSFTTENIFSSNYSLTTGVALYQGGAIRNSIKQNKLNLDAKKQDYQQASNDLALSIASNYLNVLLCQERLEMALKNTGLVQGQLNQMQKMIQAGLKPEADALEMKSQLARMDQAQLIAENNLDLAWLDLKQAMRLDPRKPLQIEKLTEDQLNEIQINNDNLDQLAESAIQSQASMKAAYSRLEAARIGEKISKSLYYPNLFLSGSIGSRYSDAAIRISEYETQRIAIPGFYVNGVALNVEQDIQVPKSTVVIPFKDQYEQFLGYGIGFNLNIPIYNQRSSKTAVQKAKLATRSSETQVELQKEKINRDVYQAYASAKASKKEFDAALRAYDATKYAHDKTQKRFDLGTASVFDLNQSQSNLQNAESSWLIAKYNLVFSQKVLDYYSGKPIKL
ncbi:MAG TPA: TolC family protein [Saprospiraceae bacterium]|nr:TolC family protein [Saprospiraceae bacterium]